MNPGKSCVFIFSRTLNNDTFSLHIYECAVLCSHWQLVEAESFSLLLCSDIAADRNALKKEFVF